MTFCLVMLIAMGRRMECHDEMTATRSDFDGKSSFCSNEMMSM